MKGSTQHEDSPESGLITEKYCEAIYFALFGKRVLGTVLMCGVDRSTTEAMFKKACVESAASMRMHPRAVDIRKTLERLYPQKKDSVGTSAQGVSLGTPPKYPFSYPFEMHHLNSFYTRQAMNGGFGDKDPSPLPPWACTPEALAFVSHLFAQSHAPYQIVFCGVDEQKKAVFKRVDLEPDDLEPVQLGKSMAHMLGVYGRRMGLLGKSVEAKEEGAFQRAKGELR